MTPAEQTKTALQAADTAILLETESDLQRASKAWKRSPLLGLDTEFVRERTYFANLGLVQISDGQTAWLVDPVKIQALEPLQALLEDPAIAKIFHSPSEDLEVLGHATGSMPEPLIDTQAACALLGKPLQMGYHTAVDWLFGITLEKEQTRSNWCARPLKQAQLHYAALDVCLLPQMWEMLQQQLEDKGRLDWFTEDCARQLERARTPIRPEDHWQRIRGIGRLDGRALAILQALAQWREQEAEQRNRPRGFIIPDPVLLMIADRQLSTLDELQDLEGLHPRAAQRHGPAICRIARDTLADGKTLEPIRKLTSRQVASINRLRRQVADKAAELSIEPTVLATRRELEILVRNGEDGPIPDRLQGWRMDVITRTLLEQLKET